MQGKLGANALLLQGQVGGWRTGLFLVGQAMGTVARVLWQVNLGAGVVKTVIGVLSSWTWHFCLGRWPKPLSPPVSLAPVTGAVEHIRESDVGSCKDP